MEAHNIKPKETETASKKLGRDFAASIASEAKRMVVAKGKKIRTFELEKDGLSDEAVEAMLGPTGNLRAPCLRVGRLILVGYNEELYQKELG
jgi:arsenate reductase-like glutaredoxin family protein